MLGVCNATLMSPSSAALLPLGDISTLKSTSTLQRGRWRSRHNGGRGWDGKQVQRRVQAPAPEMCSPGALARSPTAGSCSPHLRAFRAAPFSSTASWSLKGLLIIFNEPSPCWRFVWHRLRGLCRSTLSPGRFPHPPLPGVAQHLWGTWGEWDPTGLGSKSAGFGSIPAMPGLRMEDPYGSAGS